MLDPFEVVDVEEKDKNWLENENVKWNGNDGTITQNKNVYPPKIETLKVMPMPTPNDSECMNILGETLKSKVILITLFILVLFYAICSVAIILSLLFMAIILTIKAMIATCKFCCKMKKANFGMH